MIVLVLAIDEAEDIENLSLEAPHCAVLRAGTGFDAEAPERIADADLVVVPRETLLAKPAEILSLFQRATHILVHPGREGYPTVAVVLKSLSGVHPTLTAELPSLSGKITGYTRGGSAAYQNPTIRELYAYLENGELPLGTSAQDFLNALPGRLQPTEPGQTRDERLSMVQMQTQDAMLLVVGVQALRDDELAVETRRKIAGDLSQSVLREDSRLNDHPAFSACFGALRSWVESLTGTPTPVRTSNEVAGKFLEAARSYFRTLPREDGSTP